MLLPLPLAGAYDYRLPDSLAVGPGDFVAVPLGGNERIGVVWGAGTDGIDDARLKDVIERLDTPPLPEVSRRFVEWVSAYTLAPPGAVLRMAMSVPAALAPPQPVQVLALADTLPELRLTPARKRVLDLLAEGPPRGAIELAREAAVGPSVVKGLLAAGALEIVELPAPALGADPQGDHHRPELTQQQAVAADDLRDKASTGGFSVSLLDGVPGSGKTEVYFEAVAEALRQGRQVVVLLPEIALTAQWLGRFQARFGASPAPWHSELPTAQRRRTWRSVIEGRTRVVIGARSSLFLPFPELGLIVVDEEHDASFKQEDGVIYNARDMAVVRARLGDIPIVLASATPSLETVTNIRSGRYGRLDLPDRHGGGEPPEVRAVDLRSEGPPSGRWLSPPLIEAMAGTFAEGGQAMLFLNRRGYAPLTLCRTCGHRLACPRCTAWLVEHRYGHARLQCHHCGFQAALPDVCPSCTKPGSFVACGPGVERLAEEVAARFPDLRLAVATSDTLTGPAAAEALVRQIEGREIDLIIGTQIIAKGYHFPLLTLVGVIDADLGLAGGDLRATEHTFQLLYQVAGRAGRGLRPGRVLLQTYMPEHPVMAALVAGERDGFLEAEAAARQAAGMPPFGRLVAVILADRQQPRVEATARDLARAVPRADGIRVLGPAVAPLAILRGWHRRRFLVKAPRAAPIQDFMRLWLAKVRIPSGARLQVDVDPYSFQ